MYSLINRHTLVFIFLISTLLGLAGCGKAEEAEAESTPSAAFIKANPAVDETMEYPPRTLRVFLTELPDINNSSMRLTGPNGEVGLRGFHTMGADDLMIEIEEYPLRNGVYTIEWVATLADSGEKHSGSYQFTVAAPES